MKQNRWRTLAGWLALAVSTGLTCVWAFWGIVENFHEGWHQPSLPANVGLMLAQYLSPMLIFMALALVSVLWPRLGAGLHLLFALLAIGFFRAWANAALFLLILPLLLLAALYWFGQPPPRKIAVALVAGLPLLTLLIAGTGPAVRVAQRVDDGDRGARLMQGNGVELVWAPAGPGWPRSGTSWAEAGQICRYLAADGLAVAAAPQGVWRLPTVEEAVRSMARHGQNSGGVWDGEAERAIYETKPDKESPLWDTHSQVIYWWTGSEVDEERAYIIVYDGRVWPRAKELALGYLGLRCVKEPEGGR